MKTHLGVLVVALGSLPGVSLVVGDAAEGRKKVSVDAMSVLGTKPTYMKIPSSQVSHWVTVQLVGVTPETSATSLPYWSMVGAGLVWTEPAARVKTPVSPTSAAYHWRGEGLGQRGVATGLCVCGCDEVTYLARASLVDLDVDGLGVQRLVLNRVALDPALAPGAGGDGGDVVKAGGELHLVLIGGVERIC